LSERTGRRGPPAHETPAGSLNPQQPGARERIAALANRYGVRFEDQQDAAGALQAYEYLDWLDQALDAWGIAAPQGGRVHDVGCASFAYAAALAAWCRPKALLGIELEGFRRLRGGVNRAQRAAANVARLPAAAFLIADYAQFEEGADLVTAFFPFVTPTPVLGWRLPLSLLRPEALFQRIAHNLNPGGRFWMVNHGEAEERIAHGFARDAKLRFLHRHVCVPRIMPRETPAVISEWGTAAAS
jgi:SAM-dependent methyltransferase